MTAYQTTLYIVGFAAGWVVASVLIAWAQDQDWDRDFVFDVFRRVAKGLVAALAILLISAGVTIESRLVLNAVFPEQRAANSQSVHNPCATGRGS